MKALGKKKTAQNGTLVAFACNCISVCRYNIGNLDEGFWYDKSYELLNIGKLTERECRECWAINFCNCCAAGIEEGDKLSRKKRLEKCKSNKHVVEERLKEYCTLREYGCKFEN